MLFLSSPRGVGIAPTIELPVVSGTSVPLLSFPHFHGFRTNESQPPWCSNTLALLEVRGFRTARQVLLGGVQQCLGFLAHGLW